MAQGIYIAKVRCLGVEGWKIKDWIWQTNLLNIFNFLYVAPLELVDVHAQITTCASSCKSSIDGTL